MSHTLTLGDIQFAPGVRARQRRAVLRGLGLREYGPKAWLSAMTGFSEAIGEAVLGHVFAKTTFTKPTTTFLAIGKTAAATTDTGASIEASKETNYTNYARVEIAGAGYTLTKAAKSKIENTSEVAFPGVGVTGDTIISFWVPEKKKGEACNIIAWGTVTSTAVSSTQTPPVVAAKKLVVELE